jgi:hypothetical protein
MEKDHLEILLEDIKEKFDLVLEGHDVLRKDIHDLRQEVRENQAETNFKFDTLHRRIENVNDNLTTRIDQVETSLSAKIDAVAEDLAAHRADTESHHGIYKVKE